MRLPRSSRAPRVVAVAMVLFGALSGPADAQEPWFEVDALPPSARTAPKDLDRSSPRAALWSFLQALRRDEAERAGAVLFLPQTAEGLAAEHARQLGAVIERRLWIDLGAFSDRDDAAFEPPQGDGLAGQPRRSVPLGTLDLDGYPASIRLSRFKPEGGDAVWLFDPHSAEAAPALYAIHGPGIFERSLPRWWTRPAWMDLRRWEFAGLPLVIALSAAFGWAAQAGCRRLATASRGVARAAVDAASVPIGLFAGAGFGLLATDRMLGFSAPITTVLSPIFIGLLVVGAVIAILRVIDAGLSIVTHRVIGDIDDSGSKEDRRFYTSIYALRRVITLVAFLFGAGAVLQEINLLDDLGVSLLASAGVLTVIFGVAGQTVLGNILASLQIAIAKPIRIGDSVSYEGEWAYVEAIFYTYVRLRTWDDRRMIVPVKYFISHPFENWSMIDSKMTRTFWLTLDHEADADAVREEFLRLARQDEDVLQDETLKTLVLDHGFEGMRCRFYATSEDPTTAWEMHARLQERMIAWINDTHPQWWPRERQFDEPAPRDAA
ncbi:MAG: mechanosensitive ion channel family protein [Pseudomonadota bacterium]